MIGRGGGWMGDGERRRGAGNGRSVRTRLCVQRLRACPRGVGVVRGLLHWVPAQVSDLGEGRQK